jgi:hypothetical protein
MLNIVAELDYDYFSSSTILLVSSRPHALRVALRVVTRTLPNAPVHKETDIPISSLGNSAVTIALYCPR